MTKRIVTTIVLGGLILGSVDAFASRARENVMGRGDAGAILNSSGSMYYDSMYNIFYNPAYINDFKNWAIVEKGAFNASTPSAGVAAVHNEGGFAANIMNFNVGLFFNRADAFNTPYTLPAGIVNPTGVRPIDLVIGADMGVKWGVGVTHASRRGNVGATGPSQDSLTVRAGASVADFDPFISYRIQGTQETFGTPNTEDKVNDMTIGLRYHYGEWTPYAAYRMGEFEDTTAGQGVLAKTNSMLAGVGRNVKIGEGARLVYSVAFARINASDIFDGTTRTGTATRTAIPVDMALEGDVASWITLRAGLGYRLMDRYSGPNANLVGAAAGQTGSAANNTTARVGATLHANKFDFDWALGNGAVPAGIDANQFGFDNGFFSNASLSYKW